MRVGRYRAASARFSGPFTKEATKHRNPSLRPMSTISVVVCRPMPPKHVKPFSKGLPITPDKGVTVCAYNLHFGAYASISWERSSQSSSVMKSRNGLESPSISASAKAPMYCAPCTHYVLSRGPRTPPFGSGSSEGGTPCRYRPTKGGW